MKIGIKATSIDGYGILIEKYPRLKQFNYTEDVEIGNNGVKLITSYIEIDSLDDIISLIENVYEDIVIMRKPEWTNRYDCDYIIEIYDDWRE